MPGTNDFKPFSVGGSANVIDQTTYAALTSLLDNGFVAGVAESAKVNKVLRQATMASAVLGKIIADNGVDAIDNGDVAAFKTNLLAAILAALPNSAQASVQGSFKNLTASATGTNSTVTVAVDELVVESAENDYKTLRSVSLSINSAASGANGLDSGSLAGNSWYSTWVIWNGTTVAGLLSLSATAPTMPSGYTHKARVGWIRSDGSGNKYPLSFIQIGKSVQYKVATSSNVPGAPVIASGAIGNVATPIYVSTGISGFVPPSASKIKLQLNTYVGGSVGMIVSPNSSYGGMQSTTNPPHLFSQTNTVGSSDSPTVGEMLIESSNIYVAATAGNLFCLGWEDNL